MSAFALTLAVSRRHHWSIAVSIMCCSKSFQTVIRCCRSSSVTFSYMQYHGFMTSSSC